MDRDAHALLAGIEAPLRAEAGKFHRLGRSRGVNIDRDDFYQAGALAALRAAPRYDPARCHFWTFAAPRVRGEMYELVAGNHPMASRQQVRADRRAGRRVPMVGRLRADKANDGCHLLAARPTPPADPVEAVSDLARTVCPALSPRQARLLGLRYGMGLRAAEAGAAEGLTDSGVFQAWSRADRKVAEAVAAGRLERWMYVA
jgi:RNA polymerase sigma factor (sigma-70 family)